MVDTIVLLLNTDMYTITNSDAFRPSAKWANSTIINPGMVSKQNPTKKELALGIYKPCLTLSYRSDHNGVTSVVLKIQLSLPKLVFGNNFEELQQKDLLPLLEKLVNTLQTMGVETTATKLSQAPVIAIHYSKNIPLTDGSTPHYYIQKIKQANVKLSLDTNEMEYKNQGHSYRWHCNAYEVVFYDKIKDLEQAKQSRTRSFEKDTALQLHLFPHLRKQKKLEILRMEVRFNRRRKIKELLKKIDIKADLSFKILFRPIISKKTLLYYLDEIDKKRPAFLDYRSPFRDSIYVNDQKDQAFIAALIVHNPELKPKAVFEMFGLKKALEVTNIRQLRAMFAKHSQRSWQRLMGDVNKIVLPGIQSPLKVIREIVKLFKPLRLKRKNDY